MATAAELYSSEPAKRLALARRSWDLLARPDQREPEGDWRNWLIRSGRGAGKTRTGAEWVKQRVEQGAKWIALVGETRADVRDVMIRGPAGLLSLYPPSERPQYEPTKRRVTWPSGAEGICYSGDYPDQLRGPAHDTVWVDELAKIGRCQQMWHDMQMGLRIETNGLLPRCVITTTPRPIPLIRELMKDPETHVTVARTVDNPFLAKSTLEYLLRRYEGTRIGRQELYGELLEDVEGAIVNRDMIDAHRVSHPPADLARIVVGIDPAATSGEDADLTGILVCGTDHSRLHGYVLEDLSGRYSPNAWATKAVDAFKRWKADRIIAEINNGGEMVEHTIRMVDRNAPCLTVHATRGKHVRFEPIGALYEDGRIHHCGSYAELEDQICYFTPKGYEGGDSPDRADALVWAFEHLMFVGGASMSDVLDAMGAA